jgi:exonuclease III
MTFLPLGFSAFSFLPSVGASGGIITAWDPRQVTHLSDCQLQFSLSSSFEIAADGTRFTISNIYAPCDRERRVDFLTELQSLSDLDSDPWLLVGDFNIARYAEDKNNDNFDRRAAGSQIYLDELSG